MEERVHVWDGMVWEVRVGGWGGGYQAQLQASLNE